MWFASAKPPYGTLDAAEWAPSTASKADICSAKRHVRFTPNSDRESRHDRLRMSALPPKADMCSATRDVRFGPKADMDYLTQFLPSGNVNVNRPDSVQSMRIGSPVNIMLARPAIVRARIAKVIKRIVIANEVGIVISPGARRINWITSDIERPVDTEATSGCDR